MLDNGFRRLGSLRCHRSVVSHRERYKERDESYASIDEKGQPEIDRAEQTARSEGDHRAGEV